MRFFHDAEFYEDGRRVHPISIAVVAEDGQEFSAVYREWLCDPTTLNGVRHHRFLMQEVVPHLPATAQRIVEGDAARPSSEDAAFAAHPLIARRWRIALELEAFIAGYGPEREQHELWAYYGAYDHLVLTQTYGTMMQLPQCIPMFTRELMQLEADVNAGRAALGLPPVQRPDKTDEHDALADARWNLAFYRALVKADARVSPEPWTASRAQTLVTIPAAAFVAGHERLTSQGPNEGYPDDAMEARADVLWRELP